MIPAAIIIIAGAGSYYFWSNRGQAQTQTAAPKEWTVKNGDIQTAITSDGKVVAREGVDLSFAVSGDSLEVDNVYVKEGQNVKKGDKIASVKTETLSLSLQSAYSNYQSALASYNAKIAGPTEEDKTKAQQSIDQAQISLDQAKISLEKTQQSSADKITAAQDALNTAKDDLDKNLSGGSESDVRVAYNTLVDTIKSIDLSLETMLPGLDAIVGVDTPTLNDSFENSLGVTDVTSLSNAQRSYAVAKNAKTDLDSYANTISYTSPYSDIDTAADKAQAALDAMSSHLLDMQTMLTASITSNDLTQTKLDSFKSTVNTDRSTVNSKISTMTSNQKTILDKQNGLADYQKAYDDAVKNLETTKQNADQDNATAESNVNSRQLSLDQAKQAYETLIAPLSAADLASAKSQLTSASINYQRARLDMDKATIISPIDGVVAALNYAPGDIILSSNTSAKPVATILNKDTLFIEANVEESDISKLQVGQKAEATFDAVDGLKLDGEISFISLTSSTNNNGIVTYLVRVIFTNPENSPIREGMTATLNFVLSGVSNVLEIPVTAVRNVNGKPSVQLASSGEWTPVTTGYTDGTYVEVISGLNAGDRILY
jgi:HlyD family secretion protein